jgi:UDP-N-acetylglucosamine diphosphorylase / glucose-1-phosphate thymidylyltransferase / UDP-N-acetylgalactosamine diphosphorylase / glucosamine-1-phosphate N-acetyltransferase / galactosamine-1-phosphate N-acetyltransferase
MINIGVIPAAGRGLRLIPYTENTPKTLFEIGGKTLLERNIEILVHKIKVKKIYIIHGHLGQQIIDSLAKSNYPGIEIVYIECPEPDVGLANGLLLLKDLIFEAFVVMLGDELYLKTNHETLLSLPENTFHAACAYMVTGDMVKIRNNYGLTIRDNKILALREKPDQLDNNFLGCGTFVFTPKIFEYIGKTPLSPRTHRIELIDAIDLLARTEGGVIPVELKGSYQNINQITDYISATHLHRKKHFNEYKTSLIIPAYNEAASLKYVIEEFSGKVDEIIIAASFSDDDTVDIATHSGCKTLVKKFSGYGDALRQGMDIASGEILILVEADGSFSPDDLPKFLSYLEDADMVVGTRTTKQMIQQGANMDVLLRWGNIIAAKIMQILWLHQEPRFTDLGCTYRALWKDCYAVIKPNLTANGPEFSPEMMVEVMNAKRKIIEIPVTYRPRIGGYSKHSANFIAVAKTGLKMLFLIFRKKFFTSQNDD